MIFEVAAEPAGCGTQHVQGLAFILGSFNRFLLYQCNDHPFSFNICIFLGPAGLSPNSKLEIFYRYIFPIIHSFPSNSKCPMSNRFTGISKALVLPKDVWRPSNRESVVGSGNWTASAKVCDGMPSRAFSRAPASSEAYQARCSAYQSASLPSHVVVVMVLDNMRCDISLTVHLTCMYTWQIPTTPSIHFVAWKPPLLPLTSSHQKSLALSPSSCSGYECFGGSNGKRLTTWS